MIDLTSYHLVFDETFNDPAKVLSIPPGLGWGHFSVTPYTWQCHTPSAGDFGSSYFSGPLDAASTDANGNRVSPFSIDPVTGQLKIKAWFDTHIGHLRSGLLSTMDNYGVGFTQVNGYFEAQFKCSSMKGIWPAFWLESNNVYKNNPDGTPRTRVATDLEAEIDICEMYGVDSTKVNQHVHVWNPISGEPYSVGNQNQPAGFDFTNTHSFGALVNTDQTYFYVDRQLMWTTPTQPSGNLPLFPMINLAMGGGWPIDDLFSGGYPAVMTIDYVRVWAKNPAAYIIPSTTPSGSMWLNPSYSDHNITGFSGSYWANYPNPGQVFAAFSASTPGNARLSFVAPGATTVTLVTDLVAGTSRVLSPSGPSQEWTTWGSGSTQQVVVLSIPVTTNSQAFIAQ